MSKFELSVNAFDIDGYIANGGKLSKMRMYSKEQLPIVKFLLERSNDRQLHKRAARYALFMELVSDAVGVQQTVGQRLSETDLQNLWIKAK